MARIPRNMPQQVCKTIIFLLIIITVFSGCEPLRKKFTRAKKKTSQEKTGFLPVLEPVDYPEKKETAESRYKYHYQLCRVWLQDFLTSLDEKASQKKVRYALRQIIKQLEEMGNLLTAEKQEAITKYRESFTVVETEVSKPPAMQDVLGMKRKVIRLRRQLTEDFIFLKVKDFVAYQGKKE
ncbi:MAG: hypothetical protein WC552_05455 [Candidatus Omnitrophota bacterium]